MLFAGPEGHLYYVQGAHHKQFPPHPPTVKNMKVSVASGARAPAAAAASDSVPPPSAGHTGSRHTSQAPSVTASKRAGTESEIGDAGDADPQAIRALGAATVPQDSAVLAAVDTMPEVVEAAQRARRAERLAARARIEAGSSTPGADETPQSRTFGGTFASSIETLALDGTYSGGGGDGGSAPPDGWGCLEHLTALFGIDALGTVSSALRVEHMLGLDDDSHAGTPNTMGKSLGGTTDTFQPGAWSRYAEEQDRKERLKASKGDKAKALTMDDIQALFAVSDKDLFVSFVQLGGHNPDDPAAAQRSARAVQRARGNRGAGSSSAYGQSATGQPSQPSSRDRSADRDSAATADRLSPITTKMEIQRLDAENAGLNGDNDGGANDDDDDTIAYNRHRLILPLQLLFSEPPAPRALLYVVLKEVMAPDVPLSWGSHGHVTVKSDASIDFQGFCDLMMMASFVLRRHGSVSVVEAANQKVAELKRKQTMLRNQSGAGLSTKPSFRSRTKSIMAKTKSLSAFASFTAPSPNKTAAGDTHLIQDKASESPTAHSATSPRHSGANPGGGGLSASTGALELGASAELGQAASGGDLTASHGACALGGFGSGTSGNHAMPPVLSESDGDESASPSPKRRGSARLRKRVSIRASAAPGSLKSRKASFTDRAEAALSASGGDFGATMLSQQDNDDGQDDLDDADMISDELFEVMRRLDAIKVPPRLTAQLDAQIPKWHFAGELGRQKQQLKRVESKVGSSFRGSGKNLGSSAGTSPAHDVDPQLFASVGEYVEDSFSDEGVPPTDSDIGSDATDAGDASSSNGDDVQPASGEPFPLPRPYVRTNKTPGAAAREKQRTTAGTSKQGFVVRGIATRWVTSETYYDEDALPYAKLAQRRTTPREEAAERKFYTGHGMRAAAAILATPQATAPARGGQAKFAAAAEPSSAEDNTIDSSFKIADDRDAGTDEAPSPEKRLPVRHAPSRPAGRPMSARARPQSARIPAEPTAPAAPLKHDATAEQPSSAAADDDKAASPARKTMKKKRKPRKSSSAAAARPMSADPRQRPAQAADALSAARKRAASDANAKRGASAGPRTALPTVAKPSAAEKGAGRPLSAQSSATNKAAAPRSPAATAAIPAPPKRPTTANAARPKGGQVPASTVTSEPAAAMTPPEAPAEGGGSAPAGRNDAIRAWQLDAGDPSMEPVSPPRRDEARRERQQKHAAAAAAGATGRADGRAGGGGTVEEERFHRSLLAQYRQQFQIV